MTKKKKQRSLTLSTFLLWPRVPVPLPPFFDMAAAAMDLRAKQTGERETKRAREAGTHAAMPNRAHRRATAARPPLPHRTLSPPIDCWHCGTPCVWGGGDINACRLTPPPLSPLQSDALARLLHPDAAPAAGAAPAAAGGGYRVLVLDASTRDVVAPLLRVADLRRHGVTLHLQLAAERQVWEEKRKRERERGEREGEERD